MFSTIDELIQESKKLADAQSSGFKETLSFVINNPIDPKIIELMDILSNTNDQIYVSTTRA
ncbi:MAG: hypothetical protein LBO05_07005 [Deltaproteobacteria bacterium]|jgi:hypothetical protein|nr:hypothetical protein [Deltaproteobacteria bacterium]